MKWWEALLAAVGGLIAIVVGSEVASRMPVGTSTASVMVTVLGVLIGLGVAFYMLLRLLRKP